MRTLLGRGVALKDNIIFCDMAIRNCCANQIDSGADGESSTMWASYGYGRKVEMVLAVGQAQCVRTGLLFWKIAIQLAHDGNCMRR